MRYLTQLLKNKRFVEKNKRRFFRVSKYLTLVFLILIIFVTLYLVFIKLQIFNISDIEVSGTKSFVSETDLKELAKSRSYGQNIFLFSSKELQDSLATTFQGAKSVFVSKKLPSTLKIQIEERVPLAVIKNPHENIYFLIDGDGYVLGQVEPEGNNFPLISYENEIEVGYFLDKNTVSVYFDLLSSLDEESISTSSMSIHSDYVSMYTSKNVEVLVGMKKNIKNSIQVLGKLLEQLASAGKDVKRVDLRYDKVIVSYR